METFMEMERLKLVLGEKGDENSRWEDQCKQRCRGGERSWGDMRGPSDGSMGHKRQTD